MYRTSKPDQICPWHPWFRLTQMVHNFPHGEDVSWSYFSGNSVIVKGVGLKFSRRIFFNMNLKFSISPTGHLQSFPSIMLPTLAWIPSEELLIDYLSILDNRVPFGCRWSNHREIFAPFPMTYFTPSLATLLRSKIFIQL